MKKSRKGAYMNQNKDNEHIEKYLDDYLLYAERDNIKKDGFWTHRWFADYAVLITGGWGAGKTYFIDRYLNRKKKEIEEQEGFANGGYKYPFAIIKVSLFGAKSEEDVNQRVFEQLHSFIGSKAFKIAKKASLSSIHVLAACLNAFNTPKTKIGAAAIDELSGFAGSLLDDVISEIKKHPKNVIVVFDDVERTSMEPSELLGTLNRFVEYLHVPCILIADDSVWVDAMERPRLSETLMSMACTQEKVVGAKLKIRTTPESFLDSWLRFDLESENSQSNEMKSKKILRKYRKQIVELLHYLEVYNYRSLIHVFFEFERFLKFMPSEEKFPVWEKEDLAVAIINDFVLLMYCQFIGVFNFSDRQVDKIVGEDNNSQFLKRMLKKPKASTDDEDESSLNNVQYLLKKLVNISFNSQFLLISQSYGEYSKYWTNIWVSWLKDGYVDSEKIKGVIEHSIWFGNDENRFWRNKMLQYHMLDNKEAQKAWTEFDKALENKLINSPREIFSLFYTLSWFALKKMLPYSVEIFRQKMYDYVNDENVKEMLLNEYLDSEDDIIAYNSVYKDNDCLDANRKFRQHLEEIINSKYGKCQYSLSDALKWVNSDKESERDKGFGLISGEILDDGIVLSGSDSQCLIDLYKNDLDASKSRKLHTCFQKRYYDGKKRSLESEFINETITKIDELFTADHDGKPLLPSVWRLFYLKRILKEEAEVV